MLALLQSPDSWIAFATLSVLAVIAAAFARPPAPRPNAALVALA